MNMSETDRNVLPRLGPAPIAALVLGVIGAVLCVIGLLADPAQFFRAYLTAYLFWVGITLGCLALLMIYHAAGGAWGATVQRFFAAGAGTLPLMVVAFLPLLAGLPWLYPWARPADVASDPGLQYKAPYMNVPFFIVRAVIYFAVWGTLYFLLTRWQRRREETGDQRQGVRMTYLSGPGLVILGLSATFALVDWAMSLEPAWSSTIYAAMVAMGGVLAAFALVTLAVALLGRQRPLVYALSPKVLNDLGGLLLAFVMIWAYLAFSQYLLIWAGNLSDEIPWYLRRLQGGWEWVILAVVLLHFALPFAMLLSSGLKRNRRLLAMVALLVLVTRYVNVFWLIVPAFYQGQFYFHWLNIAAPVAIGGLWVALFAWNLARRPLLVRNDPRLERHLAVLAEQEREREAEEAHEGA